jgi:hypothetical protein
LLTHRADLEDDWVRTVNRLRRLMVGISPALERAKTFTNVATPPRRAATRLGRAPQGLPENPGRIKTKVRQNKLAVPTCA